MDTNANTKPLMVEGLKKVLANQMNYPFVHSLLILVVVTICLYNLTITSKDSQMWEKLLLFTFGMIIPMPKDEKKNDSLNP